MIRIILLIFLSSIVIFYINLSIKIPKNFEFSNVVVIFWFSPLHHNNACVRFQRFIFKGLFNFHSTGTFLFWSYITGIVDAGKGFPKKDLNLPSIQ